MVRWITVALALWLMAAAAQAQAARMDAPGDYRFTLVHGGLTRAYLVHVPARYDPRVPAPLLFALHGGGGHMELQADDAFYGIASASEREGFIAVFPNGYSRFPGGKLATWNAGRCCGGARDAGVDDVGFVRAVFARVAAQWNIDRSRVFATGMSNGGMMAYRLACEAPDLVRAVAAVAGTDNTARCEPGRAVRILHIHARDDSHVLFTGGAGPDAARAALVTDFTSVPATVAKWARLNGCGPAVRRVLDLPGAVCEAHEGCREGGAVQLCVTETGGHSWPGAAARPRGGRAASQALSANAVMWEFFKRP